mmetsp:Transcript_48718/g.77616  ORF Transcript_48718/g.77616 Transcript_48718/m.77616 type:complete len:81 (-) Transcript_48718:39-281(-)
MQQWIRALNAYVVQEGVGAPVGRVALMADATDRRASKALDAAKEAVTDPLAFASHLGGAVKCGIGSLMGSVGKRTSIAKR